MSHFAIKVMPPVTPSIRVEDVQKVLRDGFPVVRKIMMYLGAKPLPALIAVSIENFIYSLGGRSCNALASRMSYVETGLLSFACLVYNFFVAIGATVLAGFTFGRVDCFKELFKKQWTHTAMAACSVGISVLGIASPFIGMVATGGLLSVVFTRVRNAWQSLKLPGEKARVEIVQTLYRQHKEDLLEGFLQLGAEAAKVHALMANIEIVIANAQSLESLFVRGIRGLLQSSINKSN